MRQATIFALLSIISLPIHAITHKTVKSGYNWTDARTWDKNGVPNNKLSSEDVVIINHDVILDENLQILGTLVVNVSGSIKGEGKRVDVGMGGINMGELIIVGQLTVKEISVKPDDCMSFTDPYPVIHNYGSIEVYKADVGASCGNGRLYNYDDINGLGSGSMIIKGELQVAGEVYNQHSIHVENTLILKGGLLDGCGKITAGMVRFKKDRGDKSSSIQNSIDCQNVYSKDGTSSLSDTKKQDIFRIFVNHRTNELVIRSTQEMQCVSIMNPSGQMLLRDTEVPVRAMDVQDLPSGMYIAHCIGDKSARSQQFVKGR